LEKVGCLSRVAVEKTSSVAGSSDTERNYITSEDTPRRVP
jgi:hypothetical protein